MGDGAPRGVLFPAAAPGRYLSPCIACAACVSHEPVERRWVEITFLTIRLVGFVVLSPGLAAAFLAVQLCVSGFYLGALFAPNYKGMPIVPKGMKIDFLRRQAAMSRNIRGSRVIDVAMGGLNYQIEHHVFPSMPRPHLSRGGQDHLGQL